MPVAVDGTHRRAVRGGAPWGGKVRDSLMPNPRLFARVSMTSAVDSLTATTDSSGQFVVATPGAPGRYLVRARALGYQTAYDSVTLPLPADHELDVRVLRAGFDGPCSGFAVPVQTRRRFLPWTP